MIKLVGKESSENIEKLVYSLLEEIVSRTGTDHFEFNREKAKTLSKEFIESEKYFVFAALTEDTIVGCATVCESCSLYALGSFGIVQEFYVKPEFRSTGIGKDMLDAISNFAKTKKWQRLELCTPPTPEFNNTVEFYKTNGFEVTGGHKMRKLLPE